MKSEQMKPLKIGELTAKLPIIQGGMGVGVSLSSLAGAVAAAGGIGVISTAQIGFYRPDFEMNPLEANLKAVKEQIILAKDSCPARKQKHSVSSSRSIFPRLPCPRPTLR